MISIGLGFDFYGSGNIGEDLMISGFMKALSKLNVIDKTNIYASCKYRLKSQRRRFPQIHWFSNWDAVSLHLSKSEDVSWWVGLGDTPFQLTSGDWLLRYFRERLTTIRNFKAKCLINVGGESEIMPRWPEFKEIAEVFDRISTRDEFSSEIMISKLKILSEKIFTAADLAHIAMSELIHGSTHCIEKKFKLGMIVAGDTLCETDIVQIREFILSRPHPIAFLANDDRRGYRYERDMYDMMCRGVMQSIWLRTKVKLLLADYDRGSLSDLIKPISLCETIISSRYHGILIAAWLGCKVAAIGRSSKIIALAKELGIPHCHIPIGEGALESLERNAIAVDRTTLCEKANAAIKGVAFALNVG
ncbi:MAG: polysaccharide pyruvyl transferase family protein [Candidatus Omnitrophica bacterium]|nr:polysaccharide pyruvyl transferase family protein [Candidatus Omnitrophota bacterium]